MKSLVNSLFFGRDTKLSGAIALSVVLLVLLGCTCGKNFDLSNLGSNSSNSNSSNGKVFGSDDDSGDVDDNLAKATIRATTAEFANAISTEDFSTLYNDTASEFKGKFSEDQLKSEFGDFIRQKRNILPILAKAVSMDPEYTSGPETHSVGNETVMTVGGSYATKPMPVTFKYDYVKREGKWWLLRLEIYVR
jgi:hypothetical protein